MEVIFGNGLATGKFAMGSSEPLGSPSDFDESSFKSDENVKGGQRMAARRRCLLVVVLEVGLGKKEEVSAN